MYGIQITFYRNIMNLLKFPFTVIYKLSMFIDFFYKIISIFIHKRGRFCIKSRTPRTTSNGILTHPHKVAPPHPTPHCYLCHGMHFLGKNSGKQSPEVCCPWTNIMKCIKRWGKPLDLPKLLNYRPSIEHNFLRTLALEG